MAHSSTSESIKYFCNTLLERLGTTWIEDNIQRGNNSPEGIAPGAPRSPGNPLGPSDPIQRQESILVGYVPPAFWFWELLSGYPTPRYPTPWMPTPRYPTAWVPYPWIPHPKDITPPGYPPHQKEHWPEIPYSLEVPLDTLPLQKGHGTRDTLPHWEGTWHQRYPTPPR